MALQAGVACVTVCWLAALALGMSAVGGWLLFLVCLALLVPVWIVAKRSGPPPVPPMILTPLAKATIYVVVGAGVVLGLVGQFTDRERVVQVGIALTFGLLGVFSVVAARRAVRLWESGRVLPWQDHLTQDEL